jgi:hypothetical protein
MDCLWLESYTINFGGTEFKKIACEGYANKKGYKPVNLSKVGCLIPQGHVDKMFGLNDESIFQSLYWLSYVKHHLRIGDWFTDVSAVSL